MAKPTKVVNSSGSLRLSWDVALSLEILLPPLQTKHYKKRVPVAPLVDVPGDPLRTARKRDYKKEYRWLPRTVGSLRLFDTKVVLK